MPGKISVWHLSSPDGDVVQVAVSMWRPDQCWQTREDQGCRSNQTKSLITTILPWQQSQSEWKQKCKAIFCDVQPEAAQASKDTLLSCHAITSIDAQNFEFNCSFDSSSSCSLTIKTQPRTWIMQMENRLCTQSENSSGLSRAPFPVFSHSLWYPENSYSHSDKMLTNWSVLKYIFPLCHRQDNYFDWSRLKSTSFGSAHSNTKHEW